VKGKKYQKVVNVKIRMLGAILEQVIESSFINLIIRVAEEKMGNDCKLYK